MAGVLDVSYVRKRSACTIIKPNIHRRITLIKVVKKGLQNNTVEFIAP
jgi:hypothetical protein